jgi:hypothetical protein
LHGCVQPLFIINWDLLGNQQILFLEAALLFAAFATLTLFPLFDPVRHRFHVEVLCALLLFAELNLHLHF